MSEELAQGRQHLAQVIFRVETKKLPKPSSLVRYFAKLSGVSQKEVASILIGKAHFTETAIERITAGIPVTARVVKLSIFSADWKEGLQAVLWLQLSQQEEAKRKQDTLRRIPRRKTV